MVANDKSVFLAPCDFPNFKRTALRPVPTSDHSDAPAELVEADHGDGVRLWGVRNGTQNDDFFEKMQAGDLVLFYNDKQYRGIGWIGDTFHDDDHWVSTTFWDDAPAYNIYTLEGFSHLTLDRAPVHRIFGYDTDYAPRGLLRVANSRVKKSLDAIKVAIERYNKR